MVTEAGKENLFADWILMYFFCVCVCACVRACVRVCVYARMRVSLNILYLEHRYIYP